MIIFAKMLRAYKYRINPNLLQMDAINKHLGCCRFIYNWGLNKKIELYQKEGKNISKFDLSKLLPELKKQEETKWLADVAAWSLQNSLERLDESFVRFFKEKRGFPKFKSKHDNRQSYKCYENVTVDFNNNRVKLPKIGRIKAVLTHRFSGKIKTSTISKTPTGKYFVSILVDDGKDIKPLQKISEATTIGIDAGIKTMLVCSDGREFPNNKYLRAKIDRIKILQRRLRNKKKGSNNKKKANSKITTLYEKITNQRNDYIHKITNKIADENQVSAIAIEDLKLQQMMSNHCLAQALSDVSLGKFYKILGYKCAWRGINLLKIGRWEASSKTCSNCGNIKKDLTLRDRNWTCDNCNSEHDRDMNAAINIKKFALHPKNFTGAGSPDVSVEALALVKPVKQKLKKAKADL